MKLPRSAKAYWLVYGALTAVITLSLCGSLFSLDFKSFGGEILFAGLAVLFLFSTLCLLRFRMIAAAGFLSVVAAFVVADNCLPSNAVAALPADATDVREFYSDHPNGDFRRMVRARIPQAEVADYAKRVNASVRETDSNPHVWLQGPEWWTPQQAPLFFFKDRDTTILVGWEDGFVYFEEIGG